MLYIYNNIYNFSENFKLSIKYHLMITIDFKNIYIYSDKCVFLVIINRVCTKLSLIKSENCLLYFSNLQKLYHRFLFTNIRIILNQNNF